MDGRRAILSLFALALMADLAVAGLVVSKLRYGSGIGEDLQKKRWLVERREALFSEAASDVAVLEAAPGVLPHLGFRTDDPERVRRWGERTLPLLPYVADLAGQPLPAATLDRVRLLVARFSKNGGPGCAHFRDLLDMLQNIARDDGYGCCADHAQALLALGPVFGLQVRQVGHAEHTFNGVWVPELRKWVFVDAQYAIFARDGSGRYLSSFELRDALRRGDPIQWEFFGNEAHEFAHSDPGRHPYYVDFAAFRELRVEWGNNVLEQDDFERRLSFLPKAARQLIGYALGVFPATRLYTDAYTRLPAEVAATKRETLGIASLLGAGTLIPALAILGDALRTRKPGRKMLAPRGRRTLDVRAS